MNGKWLSRGRLTGVKISPDQDVTVGFRMINKGSSTNQVDLSVWLMGLAIEIDHGDKGLFIAVSTGSSTSSLE